MTPDIDPEFTAANRRIRVFSRWAFAAAALCILILAPIGLQADGSQLGGADAAAWPWAGGDYAAAERRGDTWYGEGAAVIALDELDASRPLQIDAKRQDGAYLPLVATGRGGAPTPDADRIDLSHYHSYHYLVPWASEADLWSYRSDTGPWTVTVTTPELPECGGRVEGSGGAVFVYRGDATSARFIADDRLTYSTVTTVLGTEYLGTEYPYRGPYDISVAWEDTPYAVFVIAEGRSEWRTEWSLEFDEYGESGATPCVFQDEAHSSEASSTEAQP